MKKALCTAAILCLLICSACKNNTDEIQNEETHSPSPVTSEVTEQRVLAATGEPNENGYYSIDLPRSAADLAPLEQINDRLYSISVIMSEEKTDEFKDEIPANLLWKTMQMEVSFNYGNTPPFKENSDGSYTEITIKDFNNFVNQCFKLEGELHTEQMPEGFTVKDDLLRIQYSEPDQKAFGFVMSEYKQEGQTWYIQGEIMSSSNLSFVKGEFILEQNQENDTITYKILSFCKK